jgi:dTDP-6-deoxy-L-talose 4-dehydrogenase (NAD+)
MKVVVTGATGFVGRYTVKRLLDEGYEVISITTNRSISTDTMEMLKGSEVVTIHSLTDVTEQIIDNNCVIHCAWSNVQNTLDTSHYFHAFEQISFIEKLAKFKPKKLIITGTCFEFGLATGSVSIADKTNPNTPYSQAKEFVHSAAVKILSENTQVEFCWARLFYMYGNGQHEKSIYSQLKASIERGETAFNMSRGEQLFDYMKIEEVAIKLASLVKNKVPEIVHVCKGYPTSLRGLVESLKEEFKSSISLNLDYYPYREQDSIALWGSESFESQIRKIED